MGSKDGEGGVRTLAYLHKFIGNIEQRGGDYILVKYVIYNRHARGKTRHDLANCTVQRSINKLKILSFKQKLKPKKVRRRILALFNTCGYYSTGVTSSVEGVYFVCELCTYYYSITNTEYDIDMIFKTELNYIKLIFFVLFNTYNCYFINITCLVGNFHFVCELIIVIT